MKHWLIEFAGIALMLITLPGSIELALLTFASLLPSSKTASMSREGCQQERGVKQLAVVIPAHDEAATIRRCIDSLMACQRPVTTAVSIIVVADNCTDDTAEIASRTGARIIARQNSEQRGKGFALQFAFAQLLREGIDAVLVLDADSVVDENLLIEVVRLLNLGADGVQTRYLALNSEHSAGARLRNIALMAFNVLRPRGRDRLALSCGILGNGFALTRQTLEAVEYRAHSIVEDLEYHLSIVRAGRRMVFAGDTTVRGEMPAGGAAASTQRARWEGGRARMILLHVIPLLSDSFHNPRLLEPLLELLLLPLALHTLLLAATAMIPLTRVYAAFGLSVLTLHVSLAIQQSAGGLADFAALLGVPVYLTWKITMLPSILRSANSRTAWARTERQ